MPGQVLAAVRTAPEVTEISDFPKPHIDADSALLHVEVAGICGTDAKLYFSPPDTPSTRRPVITDHENEGVITQAGGVRGADPETGAVWGDTLTYLRASERAWADWDAITRNNALRVYPMLSKRLAEVAQ